MTYVVDVIIIHKKLNSKVFCLYSCAAHVVTNEADESGGSDDDGKRYYRRTSRYIFQMYK